MAGDKVEEILLGVGLPLGVGLFSSIRFIRLPSSLIISIRMSKYFQRFSICAEFD